MIDAGEGKESLRTGIKPITRPNGLRIASVIIITIFLIAAVSIVAFNPNGLMGIGGPHTTTSLHEGDYIIWTVNGTKDGKNISGVSIWKFSNVTSHANVQGMVDWPKYDVSIRSVMNGNITDFYTAGAYQNNSLWGLGLNPFSIVSEESGYFNGATTIFVGYDTLSTAIGEKNAAEYTESAPFGSSHVWIDNNTGMPLKMSVVGAGYGNWGNDTSTPFNVLMNVQILDTNIS